MRHKARARQYIEYTSTVVGNLMITDGYLIASQSEVVIKNSVVRDRQLNKGTHEKEATSYEQVNAFHLFSKHEHQQTLYASKTESSGNREYLQDFSMFGCFIPQFGNGVPLVKMCCIMNNNQQEFSLDIAGQAMLGLY